MNKPGWKTLAILLAIVVVVAGVPVLYMANAGISAREQPGAVETTLARGVRGLAIGRRAASLTNPVALSDSVLDEGRDHFADHCASCHANDGSGMTEMGQGLYPKAPDMRLDATQRLTDGELFYIIENGIRFTGMPAWSTGTPASEEASWQLVHFIRHLPKLTDEERIEMEGLNPKPPAEVLEEQEEQRFLRGEDVASPAQEPAPHAH